MNTILKVVVGSRLHGLHNEKSDYDYRGIFMHPLKEKLSPFKNLKNTQWIEGDVDNTAYELTEFCKYATKGNPTILEILWSNMVIESSSIADELKANRHKFLNSKAIFEAHKGYAHNQYNKMNLFEPDDRTPKFAVAYIRALSQAKQLLATGEFSPQILPEDKDFLLEVKHNFNTSLVPELSRRFSQSQIDLANVWSEHHDKFEPDYEWIEDFIYRVYKEK